MPEVGAAAAIAVAAATPHVQIGGDDRGVDGRRCRGGGRDGPQVLWPQRNSRGQPVQERQQYRIHRAMVAGVHRQQRRGCRRRTEDAASLVRPV